MQCNELGGYPGTPIECREASDLVLDLARPARTGRPE